MKITMIFNLFTLIFINGCLTMTENGNREMGKYELRDGSKIIVKYFGGGATAPNGIRIYRENRNILIDELKGFDYKYIISFRQTNDSLLELTLTDTAYFKGQKTIRIINLNKRINL